MEQEGFIKVYGREERQDQLIQIGKSKWLLIFGCYTDTEMGGYELRKYYTSRPDRSALRTDLEGLINSITDESILTGLTWNGLPVYLSTENQINFKAAYDLAFQTDGATLPVKFKLGEDTDGAAVYYTFEDMDTFTDFYTAAVKHVTDCLAEGWDEKDGIDYSGLLGDE